MAIAIISVMGAGLLGFLGILVQHLLTQNAQRHDEHVVAMGAIHEQGLRMEKLHTATSELIQQSALAARQHADVLHSEAMDATTAQGLRMQELHTKAMDATTAQGLRMQELHTKAMDATTAQGLRMQELHTKAMDATTAQGLRMEKLHTRTMDAITTLDREHREHREKLHTETMAEIAALSERTAVLEANADRPEPEAA